MEAIDRNFIGGLWHGAFLALGMALTQPTTIISALVAELTGSTVWVGGLSTVLAVAGVLPQLLVAHFIEPRPRKMPYLLLAIYLRVLSWGVLAGLVYAIGDTNPELIAWALVGLLVVFYAGGGLGGVPYTDIIGKVIPADRRGAFFGGREFLAGPLAVGAALLARRVLADLAYPSNYALLFGLAAAALFIASLGFWLIREPPCTNAPGRPQPWRDYGARLTIVGSQLRALVGVQLLTGFSLMVFPFYVVYAREVLGAPVESVGWFLLAQVLGGAGANLVWARLVDRAGSRQMLTVCATASALTPLLAVLSGRLGWQGLLPIFFLAGAVSSGRKVGFGSALLELAPSTKRPTYAALNAALTLPIAFLPLLAGLLLQTWSYTVLFVIVAGFVALGAVWTRRLPAARHVN
jgi:hypothetical protein